MTLTIKHNCWEHKQCGREPNGKKATELGVCPAALDSSYNGINHGKNGGRVCWAVAGTFCGEKAQGTFADKRTSCVQCDFFKIVNQQEEVIDSPAKLLKFLIETTDNSFLGELGYKRVRAGQPIFAQGAKEDTAYIIQEGTCLTIVEKDGVMHPTGHRGKGDIVGIRALFTGEPRAAHVEAETDMHLWVLNKKQIDNVSQRNPELLTMLTEIVARQFDSKRPVADREIGKYIATHIIGRGSYSIVYKAVHKDLNMPVAIKMMRHNMIIDMDFICDFRKEARIIAGLNHENIIKVYDYEERYKTVFIITEYLEGESLQDLLKRLRVIPPNLAVSYIYQICKGLDYAHKNGIIHRDINTANVMVLKNDRIKILDFGLACQLGTDDENIGGALAYQAPELIDGDIADQRSDIYALGITAYELLTGEKPFSDKEINEMFRLGTERKIPDPCILVPETPSALCQFISKACQHDREKRYQNIGEVMEVLQPAIAQNNGGSSDTSHSGELTTINLRYANNQKGELNQLLSEFSRKLDAIGIAIELKDSTES